MSKQDNDPHLDRMFSQFVARHGVPSSRGAAPAPSGHPAFPLVPPPRPMPPPPSAHVTPGSSSALRRSSSHVGGGFDLAKSASNGGAYPARPSERRRARPIAPGPPPGPGVPAYPQIPSMDPPPGSSLYRAKTSHAPQQRPPKPKSVLCPECNAPFDSPGQLSRHVRRVHDKLKPFACEHCGHLFAARSDRSRHIKNVHKNIRRVE